PNLDQFNRVQNMVWSNYAGDTVDGYAYTRDSKGNIASKQNLALDAYKIANPSSTAPYLDEAYVNDKLDQLKSATRGQLDAATDLIMTGTSTWKQNWTVSGFGNWSNLNTQQGSGGSLTNTLDQQRTPTAAKQN